MKEKMKHHKGLIKATEIELAKGNGYCEIQAVAKRAGVSVGLVYHYFGSKGGLLAAVVEAFYAPMMDVEFGVEGLANTDWLTQERARAQAYINYHYRHPMAFLITHTLSQTPEILDVEAAFLTHQLHEGARNLRAAKREGIINHGLDPDITVALIHGGIKQALHQALATSPRPEPEILCEKIWLFISSALGLIPQKRK